MVTEEQGGIVIIGLREKLLKEQERLAHIIDTTTKELENTPEGALRIGKSQGCVQYFHRTKDTSHNGAYLTVKESDMARQLAQKAYNEKLIRYAQKSHRNITRLLQDYHDDKLEQIYYSLSEERQKLIMPIEPTYDQKLEKWLSESFVGKKFGEDTPLIETNSGIRVRSKSEKILADYFDSLGIQYKYECPLYLEQYGLVYPDFTFLSRRTGQKIYWEHEGMMDNSEYAKSAVKKIELYEKNGIFPGDNLILTFESSITVLNMSLVKELTRKYLLVED